MAKGDSTGQGNAPPYQPQWGQNTMDPGMQMGGGIGPSMGGGGWNRQNNYPGPQQQGQDNPLFQGMDPRLVQLFQKFNVNPTGTGTGNSDINYWNQKMAEKGADQQYYLNRLQSNFEGTGPDLGNNNLSYGGNQGQLANRYYQQPMQRGFGRQNGGQWGWGGSPRMNMGGQTSGGFGQPVNKIGYGGGGGYGGGYSANPNSRWGFQRPTPNSTFTPTPTPKEDTSEHPK